MAKKTVDLDTPFRKNERVLTTRDLGPIGQGAEGIVQLQNGLGEWMRYWVLFDDGEQVGQVSHRDLVRPFQLQDWHRRQEEIAEAAEREANKAVAEVESAAGGGGGGGGGIADQIPADLLERSRAAKARLLG